MKIKFKLITEEELAKLRPEKKAEYFKLVIPKLPFKKIFIALIILGFILNQLLMWRAGLFNFRKFLNINIEVNKK